jgi:adenine phosphoribosyltransferase
LDWIRAKIRDVPDFPREGVIFRDITPLLNDGRAFKQVIETMAEQWKDKGIDKVVAIESRGYIFGAPLAAGLGVGVVLARKFGTLPRRSLREAYTEDDDTVEIHEDALGPGERVLVIDDLLATGVTASAVGRLVLRARGELVGYGFLIELASLGGADKLGSEKVRALVRYS